MSRVHAAGQRRDSGALMRRTLSFTLNGKPVRLEADESRSLLWVLRTDFGLTGTKYGCGAGLCGSCTVVVRRQGRPVLPDLARRGPGQDGHDHRGAGDRRQAPPAAAGVHRSRRLPVRLLHAGDDHERLRRCSSPTPSPRARRSLGAMEGNLCRCGAHKRILAAIESRVARGRRSAMSTESVDRRSFLEARRRRHRGPGPARALRAPWPRAAAIPPTSTPTSGSARTAASPSSPARSRWGRAS